MSARPRSGSTHPLTLVLLLVLGIALVATVLDRYGGPDDSVDPCRSPLAWHIGDVDPRFGISHEQLRQTVEEAAAVWEDAVGRRLFQYDAVSGMPIHLVFDQRQERYERRMERESEIERLQADMDRRKTEVDLLERQLRADLAEHERRATEHTAAAYRGSIDRYNRAIDRYNQAVQRYNAAVREIRDEDGGSETRAGDLRQESLERNGRVLSVRRTLTVALVGSPDELLLVLGHELGHALGLDHVPDPNALMAERYQQREVAGPIRLHAADREAVGGICEAE